MREEAHEILVELVGVLNRVERCRSCQQPIGNEGFDDCHREDYAEALKRARAYLAKDLVGQCEAVQGD